MRTLTVCTILCLAALAIYAEPPPAVPPVPADVTFPPEEGFYSILPIRVIDGDTVEFAWLVKDRARLWGINAPEMHGDSAAAGKAAKEFLAGKIGDKPLTVQFRGREKYGRRLLVIYGAPGGKTFNQYMIDQGHAKPYLQDR